MSAGPSFDIFPQWNLCGMPWSTKVFATRSKKASELSEYAPSSSITQVEGQRIQPSVALFPFTNRWEKMPANGPLLLFSASNASRARVAKRSEEHTSELQSHSF